MRKTFQLVVIIFSVVIFSGISFLYHSPQKVLSFFFGKSAFQSIRPITDNLLMIYNSGERISFPVGKEFTIILNEYEYPRNQWQIMCSPQDILHKSGNVLFLLPPLYGVTYQSTHDGVCTVKNTSFSIQVHVVHSSS